MLTLDKLKELPESEIFSTGIVVDSPLGCNMANSGKNLRWVAKRGFVDDWAHWENKSVEYVRDYGDKVTSEDNIKRLVPCDDASFKRYRY